MSDRADALRLLGLSSNFTPQELKSAYRKKARSTHPDLGGNGEYFILVQKAFEILSQPVPLVPQSSSTPINTRPLVKIPCVQCGALKNPVKLYRGKCTTCWGQVNLPNKKNLKRWLKEQLKLKHPLKQE